MGQRNPEGLLAMFLEGLFFVLMFATVALPFAIASGWDGYGPHGTLIYRGDRYSLRYNDNTFGNDKPQISLSGWPPFASSVPLLEISDQHSYLDEDNLYRDFETRAAISDAGVHVRYSNLKNTIDKTVAVIDGRVDVVYRLQHPAQLNLSLWRWYFSEIEDTYWRDVDNPLLLDGRSELRFKFEHDGKTAYGTVSFVPQPTSIAVWKTPEGFNKIIASFNATEVRLVVSSDEAPSALALGLQGGWAFYPMLTLASGGLYLLGRKYGSKVKVRAAWKRH